jgi:S4 domain protein YaaA
MKNIPIESEYITLGQLLKFAGIIQNGGEAKIFLASNLILVNHEPDQRRGRKLYPDDVIEINKKIQLCIQKQNEN